MTVRIHYATETGKSTYGIVLKPILLFTGCYGLTALIAGKDVVYNLKV